MHEKEYRCKYCNIKVAKYASTCSECSAKLKLWKEIRERILSAIERERKNAK